jgi:hypothetical protein
MRPAPQRQGAGRNDRLALRRLPRPAVVAFSPHAFAAAFASTSSPIAHAPAHLFASASDGPVGLGNALSFELQE